MCVCVYVCADVMRMCISVGHKTLLKSSNLTEVIFAFTFEPSLHIIS